MVASSGGSHHELIPEPTPYEDAEHINGLTHPSRYLCAAGMLWRRRGKLTSTLGHKSEWVERLFVMTDTAVCWFDQMPNSYGVSPTPIGAQCGRIDVRHFVSMSVVERPGGVETQPSETLRSPPPSGTASSSAPTTPADELERVGPRHTLEIHTITAEQTLILGSTDRSVIDAWLAVLSKAVGTASTTGVSAAERPFAPAPLGKPTSPELLPLLSPENSGVRACGVMQKARGGLERTFRDHKKDGWSTRLLVLTDSHLVYYKQLKAPEDDGPLFWGVGSSLRAGEFIFGQERGRMPLANADVYAEKVNEWFHITLTAPLHNDALGISPDSLFSKGLAKITLGIGANSDRFKATLRTQDAALAAEWAAVLRSACGAMMEKRYSKLHAAIAQGNDSAAAAIATELALLRNKVAHRNSEEITPVRRGRREPPLRLAHSVDSGRAAHASPPPQTSANRGASCGGAAPESEDGRNSEGEILGTELPDRMVPRDAVLGSAHAALSSIADEARSAAAETPLQPQRLLSTLGHIAAAAAAAATAVINGTSPPPPLHLPYASSNFTSAYPSSVPSPTQPLPPPVPSSPHSPRTSLAPTPLAPPTAPPQRQTPAPTPQTDPLISPGVDALASSTPGANLDATPTPGIHPDATPTPGAGAGAAAAATAAELAAAAAAAAAATSAAADVRPLPGQLSAAGVDATTPADKRWATAGDGSGFDVRVGPDYRRNKRKAASAAHVYQLMAADVIRGPRMLQHAAAHVRLPQAEDADQDNDTGLPRTLVFNVAIPVGAPSLMGGGDDSKCYQLVLFFRASVAALREWRDGGSPAYALFRRWVEEAPHGNVEVKERFKLIVRMENLRELGRLGSTLEQYNGKPVLITKSGSTACSPDDMTGPGGYLEMDINTARFAYITKIGMAKFIPSLHKLRLHIGVVIEGRDNSELPEQTLVACRIHGLDLREMATEINK